MAGSRPKFPDLNDRTWWDKNWNNSNTELARRLGCSPLTVLKWRARMGVRVYQRAGPLLGREAEEFVIGRIKENGGNVEHQDWGAPFDLKMGGIRIDVKSSSPGPIYNTHPSPYYSFALKRNNGEDCDFYIFVAKHPEDWACFIVPSSAIGEDQSNIHFRWPSSDPKWNSWIEYLERWDLLGLLE